MSFFQQLRHLPDFVKLSHSVFAMPFALAAMILAANGFPPLRIVALIISAVVTARLAAMAFNRIVDREFDAANPRTAKRHLPTGQISISTAWGMVVAGCSLFIFFCLHINPLTTWLSPVALAIIFGYSFTKRFTHLSHFFLGLALALAPLGAWVAVRGSLDTATPFLIALAVICWVAGFDMIYALQDIEFDRAHGLYSMVVKLGPGRTIQFVRILHIAMLLILVQVGISLKLHWPYFTGLIAVAAGIVWEHWLMRKLEKGNLQLAFLEANAVASFGYLIAVMLEIFAV